MANIHSFSAFGFEGAVINVEAEIRRGIPAVDIVGLSDGCVRETLSRVRAAVRNQNIEFPTERVLLCMSPCDMKKDGTGFDLPIALSILAAKPDYPVEHHEDIMVLGELNLSGHTLPCNAIYPALCEAVANGIKYAIIPDGCESASPDGITVLKARCLSEAYDLMLKVDKGEVEQNPEHEPAEHSIEFCEVDEDNNLDTVEGNVGLKYAMAVAAAGGHHLLAYGRPGCGKTVVLHHMPELLTSLTEDERHITTRIHSLAGLRRSGIGLMKWRPFRMPHQTASIEGICGGGVNCRPGEISLAHNGVLFLDEAVEFRSSVLQMLRVPLESNFITLSRAGRTTTYPAKFQLIMATNPCPCGNFGSEDRVCLCSAKSVEMYWRKFPAPLIDRIAIRIRCDGDDVLTKNVSLDELRSRIKAAYERQIARQGKRNQDLSPSEVEGMIKLSAEAEDVLKNDVAKNDLSQRSVANIMKLAQTLADMYDETESCTISREHLEEALRLHGNIPVVIG